MTEKIARAGFAKFQVSPLMTAEEFKGAREKAKNVKSSYTPPTATKQSTVYLNPTEVETFGLQAPV